MIRFHVGPRHAVRTRSTSLFAAAAIALAAMALLTPAAHAQTTTWTNGTANQLWFDAGNWTNGIPTGPTDQAIFPNPVPPSGGTVNLGGNNAVVRRLVFDTGYTLSNGNINLTFGQATANAGNSTIIASISGTAGLAKLGSGIINLQGNNTYLAATTIQEGVLDVSGSNERLPDASSVLLASGAQLRFFLGLGTETIGSLGDHSITGGGTVIFGNSDPNGTHLRIGANNSDTSFSGNIIEGFGGTGRITKIGTGSLSLTGTVGVPRIDVDSGTLNLSGPSLPNGVQINAFGGTLNTNSATSINNGGSVTIFGGALNANQNFTVNNSDFLLTSAAGSSFSLAQNRVFTASNNAQANFNNAANSFDLSDNSTFNVNSGADVTFTGSFNLGLGGANGTLNVNGMGTTFNTNTTNTSSVDWGFIDGHANVTVSNEAVANINASSIIVGSLSTPSTTSSLNLNVLSGADMTANNISLVQGVGGTANVFVDGPGSTLTQNGASTLGIGGSTNSSATVTVSNNGVYNTGTGTTTISPTGALSINTGGTFNANGDVNVNGGTLARDDVSAFNLAAGKTLTASNDAQINFTGTYEIINGTTFNIHSGADLSTTSFLDVGAGANGTLIVDGSGSSVTASGQSFWGQDATANITVRNNATFNAQTLRMAVDLGPIVNAIVNVQTGGSITANGLVNIAEGVGTATVNVTNPGSSFNIIGGGDLNIGSAISTAAAVNVTDSAIFNAGTGLTTIHPTGTLTVDTGGTFNADGGINNNGTVQLLGSQINTTNFINTDTFTHTGGRLTVTNGTFDPGVTDYFLDGAGSPEVVLNNATLNLAGILDVGRDAAGQMTIENGSTAVTAGSAFVGSFTNSDGTLIVDGDNTTLTVGGELRAGSQGTAVGTIEIRNGADVVANNVNMATFNSAVGTVIVDGNGSTLTSNSNLFVGFQSTGQGKLTVRNGGQVSVNSNLSVATGSVVELLGSQISTRNFNSSGTLIHQDGTLIVDGGTFNPGTPGHTVDGADATDLPILRLINGASASLAGTLRVGVNFNAELHLINGAAMTAGNNAFIGDFAGSHGAVFIDNATLNITNTLVTGQRADSNGGDITIINGGTLTAGGVQFASGNGTTAPVTKLTVDGPASSVSSNASLGIGGGGRAELVLKNGGVANAINDLQIFPNGRLTGDGQVNANLVRIFGSPTAHGTVDPGQPGQAGQLAVNGNYLQDPDTVLQIDIAGNSGAGDPNGNDRLAVTQNVSLHGEMDVSLLGGFVPKYGEQYSVLTYGSRAGTFDKINGTSLSNLRALAPVYDFAGNAQFVAAPDSLSLFVTAPGDANLDLIVDFTDLAFLASGFNKPGGWLNGDFNGDNIVDFTDLAFLASNFNKNFQPLKGTSFDGATAIPEPATLLIWLVGVPALIRRRGNSPA